MSTHSQTPNDIVPQVDACELAASCLNCPLRHCKYDKKARNKEILYLWKQGRGLPYLVYIFGLGEGTIRRIIQELR